MKNIRHLIILMIALGTSLSFSQENKDKHEFEPRILRGTDAVIAAPKPALEISGSAAGLKFEDAPLADVVHVVLREIANVSYLVHPPITGSVTLSTQGNVSVDQALVLLEYALQANGYLMAQDTRGTYHIGKPEIIKAIVPAVRQAVRSSPLSPGYGAVIIPLKYIGAAEMASILKPLAPPESLLRVDTVRNLLVMMGNRTQAEGWMDLVSTFDVDMLKGMSVGVFPLKYVSTKDIDLALRVLNAQGAGTVAMPATSAAAKPAETSLTSLAANFPLFGALRIVPIDRINSIMVVTPRAAYLDEARQWIEKLDKPGTNASEAQLFVYSVQNGSAGHLATVLNGLFGTGTTTQSTAQANGVAPGLTPVTANTGATTGSTATALASNTGRSSVVPATAFNVGASLRVMADEINNAVLIYGTLAEYAKVEATLKRLDVTPTQILIQASIIEVTLTDDLQYGLQWVFNDSARAGLEGTGVLSKAAGAALGVTPAGFSYTLRNALGGVQAVLNALAEKSLLKVISSPSLMVLDNHTASIVVGSQQPIKVGETISTIGVSTNIQYKDTGVSLTVTPSVNAGNMVTMQINQTVSDVGAVDIATGQRSFLQRQIGSKVAVRSGETLVLGGLIRDNTSDGKSGLPVLQDIPLFGNLFGSTSKNTNRTELLVVITPQVVRTEQDVRELTTDLRGKMKALDWAWAKPSVDDTAPAPANPLR